MSEESDLNFVKEKKFDELTGRFDNDYIDFYYGRIKELKEIVEDTESNCKKINHREVLLGLKLTKFHLIHKLIKDVKPYY